MEEPAAVQRVSEEAEGSGQKPRGPFRFLGELPGLIFFALLLALLIKAFLVQAFFIPSSSMEHTLEIGDRVLVNKVAYRFREPRRGDVIVFVNPEHKEPDRNPLQAVWTWITEGLGVSADPKKDFIKRIVALPGETFEYRGGKVFIDGRPLEEPYLNPNRDTRDHRKVRIKPGRYWVMGDNRASSEDSRSFGAIAEDRIVGRAFVILWPPGRAGWLEAP